MRCSHTVTGSVTAFVSEITSLSAYSVTDIRSDLRLAALRDAMGRKYVVHLSAEVPDIGAQLVGGALRRGTRVMLVEHTGQVFDATVDASECTEQYVFERLRVTADRASSGMSPTSRSPAVRPVPTQRDIWTGLVRAPR
jgi:hypothetical protein